MPQVKDMNFGHLGAPIAGTTNVETLAITSNPVIMPNPTAHILIHGSIVCINGAGAGNIQYKLYRGTSLSGTLILTSANLTVVGGQLIAIAFDFQEDLANSAGAQYTLSVINSTNQAGNTINNAEIVVTVL